MTESYLQINCVIRFAVSKNRRFFYLKVQQDNTIAKGNPPFTSLPKGFEPRHMTITTRLTGAQKAYVINEKQPFVTILEVNDETGKLTQQYSVETLPSEQFTDAEEYGAEIALHPNENWLYVSHRHNGTGAGAIIVFRVLENGLLKRIQVYLNNLLFPYICTSFNA